jgi:enterochelin esterase-like enzyme
LPARYAHGPDSFVQADVPRGSVHERDTPRRHWVYVPAQYTPEQPASLLVVQDPVWYLDLERETRAPIVFDNLIHRGEMPVTIAVFVEPPEDRNAEYDAFDDRYATFLVEGLLPLVQGEWAIGDDWAIAGGSSGGNCAFTAAWFRPDRFRRVYCASGSFVQIPGGNPYPALIRSTPRKQLRIWLQAASRDLNHDQHDDNWFSSNLEIAAALAERGYDFRFVVGEGAHDGNHAAVLFPDAMRWLWR